MDEHLERLERSAKEIQLQLPYTMPELKRQLKKLAQLNNLNEGIIYLQISRGASPRWHEFPEASVPAVTVAYTREEERIDRKSTRLNSSHASISYAVFCSKKKKVFI